MPEDRLGPRRQRGPKVRRDHTKRRTLQTVATIGAIAALLSVGAGLAVWAVHAPAQGGGDRTGAPWRGATPAQARAAALLDQLTREMEPALAQSRDILLGTWRPGYPSCITQRLDDNRIVLQGRTTGGAGERMMAFYAKAPLTPLALYSWSQEKLRPYLQAEQKTNTSALARIEDLAAAAKELAAQIHTAPGSQGLPLPEETATGGLGANLGLWKTNPGSAAWPAECLRQLRTALTARDVAATQTWADELAAATFGWADLHRWVDLLHTTHLTSLDYQARCRAAFVYAETAGGTSQMTEPSLPAGGLMVAWGQNYLEAEHQAEGLFNPPDLAVASVASDNSRAVPSARWMPVEVRPAFRWLRAKLSPAGQAVWDRAAAAPFDRSYLANMLFRSLHARSLEQMSLTLQRFEQSHPTITQAALMDVLFYRSGFYSSGFHWADRYDRRLLDEAATLRGDRETVARHAQQLTNSLLQGWQNYQANILSLSECLDRGKFDCVRGTDLIGALYRNAGQGEYFVVRLRCGTAGHSVGAIPVEREGKRQLLILDCLRPEPPSEVWPSAFFQDFRWPAGYPGSQGPLFSAELYARGLDGYLFAAGYVVRDEAAGQLVRAALPYVPTAPEPGITRAYAGPYPSPTPRAPSPISMDLVLSHVQP